MGVNDTVKFALTKNWRAGHMARLKDNRWTNSTGKQSEKTAPKEDGEMIRLKQREPHGFKKQGKEISCNKQWRATTCHGWAQSCGICNELHRNISTCTWNFILNYPGRETSIHHIVGH